MKPSASAVALASASALVVGAYLDVKLGISIDLRELSHDREWQKRFAKRLQTLSSNCTVYHMLDQADQEAEALWFEGRTWTYAELKNGAAPVIYSKKYH